MTEVSDVGLFLILPTPGKSKVTKPLYAKVSSITLYTVPQPTRKRLLSYQVTYWVESPIDNPEAVPVGLWRLNGDSTFNTVIPVEEFSFETLSYTAIEHFLTFIASERYIKPLRTPLDKLLTRQKGGRGWGIFIDEQAEQYCIITEMYHMQVFQLDEQKILIPTDNLAIVTVQGKQRETIPCEYKTEDGSWEDDVDRHIVNENTFYRRVAVKYTP